jgi:hypothetical protein
MKKFAFSLETARKWRERLAEMEEVRLLALLAEKRTMEGRVVSLQAELDVEHRRIEDRSFDARELPPLDNFRIWAGRERERLRTSLSDCEKRIFAQRTALVEARRRFRIIDRLKEKSLLEWRKASSKEQEDLAAELYLARRGRGDH